MPIAAADVREQRHHDAHDEPAQVGGAQGGEAVADVGELRQEDVERADERGDHEERPGPDADQTLERRRLLAGRRRRSRCAVRAAAPSTPACESRPTAPAAGGRDAARARSSGPSTRAADATTRGRRPTSAASDASSSARSMACMRGVADSSPKPEVDDHRLGRRPRGCSRRAATGARGGRGAVRRDLAPDGVEQVVVDLVGRQSRRAASVDVLHGERHRAVGQRGEHLEPAGSARRRCAQEQQEGLVLDVVLERQRRPVVVRAAQQQRAVAAVQEVGVAAVLRVHLDERAPTVVGRRRRRAASDHLRRARSVKAAHRRARAREGGGHGGRRGPAVRRAEHDEHGGTHGRARGHGEQQLGHAGTFRRPPSRTTSTSNARSAARRHERDSHGLPTVAVAAAPRRRTASAGSASTRPRCRSVTASGSRPGRSSTASSSANDAAPATAASTTTAETAPPPPDDQHDDA